MRVEHAEAAQLAEHGGHVQRPRRHLAVGLRVRVRVRVRVVRVRVRVRVRQLGS